MNDVQKINGAEAACDLEISNGSNNNCDDYNVDVETAAELLGVGATRLSQLTTRGSLSFQRRKVGFRNRLFYKKSEIDAYLQQYFPPNSQHTNQTERMSRSRREVLEANFGKDEQPLREDYITSEQLDFSPIIEAIRETSTQLKKATNKTIIQPKANKKASALELRQQRENETRLQAVHHQLEQFQQSFTKLELKIDSIQRTLHAMASIAEKKQLPAATAVAQLNAQANQRQESQQHRGQQTQNKWPSFTVPGNQKMKTKTLKHQLNRVRSHD